MQEAADNTAAIAIESSRVLGTLISVERDIAQVPIFFATNRVKALQGETQFTGEQAGEISYGLVPVSIPVKKHKTGNVEVPHWWTLFPNKDKEHRFVTLSGLETFLTPGHFATAPGE